MKDEGKLPNIVYGPTDGQLAAVNTLSRDGWTYTGGEFWDKPAFAQEDTLPCSVTQGPAVPGEGQLILDKGLSVSLLFRILKRRAERLENK